MIKKKIGEIKENPQIIDDMDNEEEIVIILKKLSKNVVTIKMKRL